MVMTAKSRVLWTVLLLGLCGCSAANLNLAYEPAAPPKPLRAEKMPRVFLEPVEDRTPKSFQLPGGPQMARFEPPADSFLWDALRTELNRLGIPIVSEKGQADAVLQAALTMNEFTVTTSAMRGSTLSVLLMLKTPAGKTIWENTITGTGTENAVFLTPSALQRAARHALTAVMAQIGPSFEEQRVIARIFSAGSAPIAKAAVSPGYVRSDVDELPPVLSSPRERAYAVVIGIRRYLQPLPEADFADNDAELVKTYLTKVMGYADANVAALINEQATKSGFEKYFESWLPNRAEDGADVFVYFAGHGAPDPKAGGAYMVPYDGDPNYLAQTGYPVKRLYAELAKLPAGKVTVVLDSCFSGAGGRSILAKGARPLVMVSAHEGIPDKLTVLSAAAGDQISYTYQDKGHGLFTYFLLKGIKEQSGRPVLEMKAVFDYAAPQVTGLARREYNADQVPQLGGKP
ncbi:MAG: caspase family protein [Thermodesulfobacteriota bacterium]